MYKFYYTWLQTGEQFVYSSFMTSKIDQNSEKMSSEESKSKIFKNMTHEHLSTERLYSKSWRKCAWLFKTDISGY